MIHFKKKYVYQMIYILILLMNRGVKVFKKAYNKESLELSNAHGFLVEKDLISIK